MAKCKLGVLFGGASSEHEISRLSVTSVLEQIDKEKYDISCIGITKQGSWWLYQGDYAAIADGSWEHDSSNLRVFCTADPSLGGVLVEQKDGSTQVLKLDVVFPVLHGKNGEDGTIQGLLQMAQIPFVGCDTLGSATCMDKITTNLVLQALGIEEARFCWFLKDEFEQDSPACLDLVEHTLQQYPVFVKPSNAGSSVGVSKASNREELKHAIEMACKEDDRILVEEAIIGQEVECAVLGNSFPTASTPGEIAPSNEFYDYEAKYLSGTSALYIPAHISEEAQQKLRENAVRAYRALGCSGLSRVDFFVEKGTGRVLLNEINTLPGFTSISMYPKMMEYAGVPYTQLIDRLVSLALERASQ